MDLLTPSTTNRKRRGDRGQPYLIPLSAWKKGDVAPLISTEKDIIVMQVITHLIKAISNPK